MNVFLLAAVTVDGFIGRNVGQSSLDWTCPEDKRLFVELTKTAGVMVMGSHTFATINRGLPGRKIVVMTHHPDQIASIEGVTASQASPAEIVSQLADEGYDRLAVCGGAVVYTDFLQARVIDEIYLTVEPVIFGSGIRLINAEVAACLQLLESRQLNDNTILLRYRVQK